MAAAKPVEVPFAAKLIAGGIAGVIGTSIIFPIDLVKTRLQNQVSGGGVSAAAASAARAVVGASAAAAAAASGAASGAAATASAAAAAAVHYTGPIDCFRKTVAKEGVIGLYSGLRFNLLLVFPEKALKLAVNDTAREAFTKSNGDGKIRLWQEVAAGGTAGLIQVAITNPMEIVKLRMQLDGLRGVQRSMRATVSELWFRGLYKGLFACWLRDVPFSFIFFPLFSHTKAWLHGDSSIGGLFAAGAIAGSIAAGAVTPADVIKTRLQVEGAEARYSGVVDCATKIMRNEGPVAFTKGLVPRMLVQAPLFGCTLLSYEVLKAYYARHPAVA